MSDPTPEQTNTPVLDLTIAVHEAAYALFLQDIRTVTSRHGMGVTDDDVRALWDKASDAERFYWEDLARPIVHRSAAAVLDAGWAIMTATLGIEGHDSPWRTA